MEEDLRRSEKFIAGCALWTVGILIPTWAMCDSTDPAQIRNWLCSFWVTNTVQIGMLFEEIARWRKRRWIAITGHVFRWGGLVGVVLAIVNYLVWRGVIHMPF